MLKVDPVPLIWHLYLVLSINPNYQPIICSLGNVSQAIKIYESKVQTIKTPSICTARMAIFLTEWIIVILFSRSVFKPGPHGKIPIEIQRFLMFQGLIHVGQHLWKTFRK